MPMPTTARCSATRCTPCRARSRIRRPARRGRCRRPLSRCHPRGSARTWRSLVLRRILRDLAPARVNDMAAVMTTTEDRADPIDAIAEFMAGFSLEATRPSAEEVAALAAVAPASTSVYISAVPKRPAQEAIEAAARLRKAGFEPVPHLAARGFASTRALDDFLARMSGEAGVVRLLVIAGDREEPTGEFRSAIEVIDGGALQRHGICEIGVAGYPDGHPRLLQQDLDRALADKIRAAESTGLAVHIVTQFCFDAQAILQWIARLRDFGLEHPVRIGLAGPTNLAILFLMAQRSAISTLFPYPTSS